MRLLLAVLGLLMASCPEGHTAQYDPSRCEFTAKGHCFCTRVNGYETGLTWAPTEVCDDHPMGLYRSAQD